MKIEYQDYGAVANIVITSTVFEFRRHNRAIDVALLLTPERPVIAADFSS